MIFDTLDNVKNYAGLGRVYEALEYIAEHGITYESVLADMERRRLSGGRK